jgi:hypothetical protein
MNGTDPTDPIASSGASSSGQNQPMIFLLSTHYVGYTYVLTFILLHVDMDSFIL